MPETLPFLARWLVRLTVPRHLREAVLGDLEEELRSRLGTGRGRARRACLLEAVRSAFHFAWRRRATAPAPRNKGETAMEGLLRDFRFALRGLRRQPGFTTVVVLTLAVGIGATTAVYSVFDGVLLRPLPYPEPDRLVRLWGYHLDTGAGRWSSSYPDFEDFRDRVPALDGLAAFTTERVSLVGAGRQPERLAAAAVSHDLFDLLGLEVVLGRDLVEGDDRRGAEPVVVLSHGLWRRAFGADADILGRCIILDDVPHTVVGVLGRGPRWPETAELWLPLEPRPSTDQRGVHNLGVIGRLANGTDMGLADRQVADVARDLSRRHVDENAYRGARLEPLHEAMVGRLRPRLALLLGAAGTVLLIVCANVSSLLLSRAAVRGREVATRSALGASHRQLLRQFFAEAALLVSLGGVFGLVLAHLGKELLVRTTPGNVPRLEQAALDPRVLAFAAAVTAGTGLLFGLVPIFEVLRRNLYRALGTGDRGGGGRLRARQVLVVAEVALAVVLVTGAGRLIRSFHQLYQVEPGYRADGVLAFDLELPTPYVSDDWPRTLDFFDRLDQRLEALPGVRSAAAALHHPADGGWDSSFVVEGEPPPAEGYEPEANFRPVAEGYFETAGIALVEGRDFDHRDRPGPPGAVIVNQAFVRQHLPPDRSPLGRRLIKTSWWLNEIQSFEIVGVAADVRFDGPHAEPRPAMYFPHRQWPVPQMTVLVRTDGDPLALREAVRQAVWAIDDRLPVGPMATLGELAAGRTASRRFVTRLIVGFAAVALFLAALGIYGVLAHLTQRRRREMGIRMALGARAADVRRLVIGQGARLTLAGLAFGLTASLYLGRFLEAFLYATRPLEPVTLAGVALVLLAVALIAAYLPANRAGRVEPSQALRDG